jgi:hypothetical protein
VAAPTLSEPDDGAINDEAVIDSEASETAKANGTSWLVLVTSIAAAVELVKLTSKSAEAFMVARAVFVMAALASIIELADMNSIAWVAELALAIIREFVVTGVVA